MSAAAARQCPRCGVVYAAGASGTAGRCAADDQPLAPLAQDVLIGRVVGPYRIEALLAAGRSHRVYRAEDERLKRTVALKVAHGEIAGDAAVKKSYLYAASLSELRDPELFVHVVDARVSEEGLVLVALELSRPEARGRTLAEALVAGESFAAEILGRWAIGLAAGLHALHRKGRSYGGVEPRAIWLDAPDQGPLRARWLDAGLAEVGAVQPEATFAAPEGGQTPAGDVYGLGAVLRAAAGRSELGALGPLVSSMTARAPADRPAIVEVMERLSSALALPMPTLGSMRPRRADSQRPTRESSRPGKADSSRPTKEPRGRGTGPAEPQRASKPESLRPGTSDLTDARSLRAPRRGWAIGAGVALLAVAAVVVLRTRLADDALPERDRAPAAAVGVPPIGEPALAAADSSTAAALAGVVEPTVDAGAELVLDAGRGAQPVLTAGGASSSARDAGRELAREGTRDAGTRAKPAVVEAARVVDPGLVPAAPSPGMERYDSCDRQLGRTLKDAGRTFADLETAAPDSSRLWARWYKRTESPALELVESTCAELLAAARGL